MPPRGGDCPHLYSKLTATPSPAAVAEPHPLLVAAPACAVLWIGDSGNAFDIVSQELRARCGDVIEADEVGCSNATCGGGRGYRCRHDFRSVNGGKAGARCDALVLKTLPSVCLFRWRVGELLGLVSPTGDDILLELHDPMLHSAHACPTWAAIGGDLEEPRGG